MSMSVKSVRTDAGQVIAEFSFLEMISREIRESIMDYCDENRYRIVSLNIYDVGWRKEAIGVFEEVRRE